MSRWERSVAALRVLSDVEDGSELIEEILALAPQVAQVDPAEVTGVLLQVLDRAVDPDLFADVLTALALSAPEGREDVTDRIHGVWLERRADAFLGPETLRAFGRYAERDALALATIRPVLMRLDVASVPDGVAVQAAKVIGRLERMRRDTGVRDRLVRWSDAESTELRGEARYQRGALALSDALYAPSRTTFVEALRTAALAFARAAATEEFRPDAEQSRALVDALLAFAERDVTKRGDADELRARASALLGLLGRRGRAVWEGYAMPHEAASQSRMAHLAVGLSRLAERVGDADVWLDFDGEAEQMAAALHLMTAPASDEDDDGDALTSELRQVGRLVVIPRLGPLLARAVRRARLERLLAHRVATVGEDHVTETIRNLLRADRSREDDAKAADSNDQLTPDLGPVAESFGESGNAPTRLKTDRGGALRLGLLANDPDVDEALQDLLPELWQSLGSYPADAWHEVVDLLESMVGFVRDLQDELPDFVRCTHDGGKGESASEGDLQHYLYQRLRQIYRHNVLLEPREIAGGRADLAVLLPHCAVPIEVKAEHRDVSREHIREGFVSQADAYAAARDRVAVLMVLDLRPENAASHRDARPKRGAVAATRYSVQRSFWAERLPGDPQVDNDSDLAKSRNGVVVGLVQGNLPRPSSTSRYSRR